MSVRQADEKPWHRKPIIVAGLSLIAIIIVWLATITPWTDWAIWKELGLGHAQGETDIPHLIEQLKSDDDSLRYNAREALASKSIDNLPVMMQHFRDNFNNYRIRLGVCIALAKKLRADKTQALAISDKLTLEDFNRLIDAIEWQSGSDNTVQNYATEFLSNLGNPQVAILAVKHAASAMSDKTRENLLLSAQDGWQKLSATDKQGLAVYLEAAKQKSNNRTKALIDKFDL